MRTQYKRYSKAYLSRTIRSCRATTHSDLVHLWANKQNILFHKHGKICKPLVSISDGGNICDWYFERLFEFNQLRTETKQICLTGDSKEIDLIEELKKIDKSLHIS